MAAKNTLLIIGIIVLILGAIAYAFTVTETDSFLGIEDQDTSAPYRGFAFPLLIAGIVLIIVSAAMSRKESK